MANYARATNGPSGIQTSGKGKNLSRRTSGALLSEPKHPEPTQDEPKLYSPKAMKTFSSQRKLPKGAKVVPNVRAANGIASASTQGSAPPIGKSPPSEQPEEPSAAQQAGETQRNGIAPVTPAVLNQRPGPSQAQLSNPKVASTSAQKEYEAFMKRKKEKSSNLFITKK